MPKVVDHLLIGGGVAAPSCARALHDAAADGSVVLVTREADPPYHRPAASKELLQGRQSAVDTYVDPMSRYAEAGVELLLKTSVMAIDPSAKTARLSAGGEVQYRTPLLAPGAMVRRLRVEGAQLEGIHYLRTCATPRRSARMLGLVAGSYASAAHTSGARSLRHSPGRVWPARS